MTADWAVHIASSPMPWNWMPTSDIHEQLRSFPPLPNIPDIGFRAWSTYVSQVDDIQLYEAAPNGAARGLADWVSITEQYLLQQHPWAPQGRAYNLAAQPLVPAKAGAMWKKGKPAYWEQLQARLNIIQHQPQPWFGQSTAKCPAALDR